jgi:putative Mn2+ efflux pump MntP
MNMETSNSQVNTPARKSRLGVVLWTIIAILISFMATGADIPPHTQHLALKFFFVWIAGALLGIIGVRIGDALRRAAKPDFIITSGGLQGMLGAKIFWRVGPQTVGLLIGTVVGCSTLMGWVA